jgi:hypothetical protein
MCLPNNINSTVSKDISFFFYACKENNIDKTRIFWFLIKQANLTWTNIIFLVDVFVPTLHRTKAKIFWFKQNLGESQFIDKVTPIKLKK